MRAASGRVVPDLPAEGVERVEHVLVAVAELPSRLAGSPVSSRVPS